MPTTEPFSPRPRVGSFGHDADYFPRRDPMSLTFVYHEGHHHVVIFWKGQLDYRGSASHAETALKLATERGDFIIRNPATAELTRITPLDWLIPYCPRLEAA